MLVDENIMSEKYPSRFAYVDFETPEAKKAAIARSEQPLIGRKLLIKDGALSTNLGDPAC